MNTHISDKMISNIQVPDNLRLAGRLFSQSHTKNANDTNDKDAKSKVKNEMSTTNINAQDFIDRVQQNFSTSNSSTRHSQIIDAINNRVNAESELLDKILNGEHKIESADTLVADPDRELVDSIGTGIIKQAQEMGLSEEISNRLAGDFAIEYHKLSNDPVVFVNIGERAVQSLRNLALKGWPEFSLYTVNSEDALENTTVKTESDTDTLTVSLRNKPLNSFVYNPIDPKAIEQAKAMQEWAEGLAERISDGRRQKLMVGNYEIPGDVLNSLSSKTNEIKSLTPQQAAQIKSNHSGTNGYLGGYEEKAALIVDMVRAGALPAGMLLTLRDMASGTYEETKNTHPIIKKFHKALKSDNFIEDMRDFCRESVDFLNKELDKVKLQQSAKQGRDVKQYRREQEKLRRYRGNLEGGLKAFSPVLKSFELLFA